MPYRLARDRTVAEKFRLEAAHPVGLLGVRCPRCGVWAAVGAQYPLVRPDAVRERIGELPSELMAVEEFATIRALLVPLLDPGATLLPGASFGPIRGKARGPFADFVWLNPWTPLLRASAAEALESAGAGIPAAVADLTIKPTEQERLLELSALPRLHVPVESQSCDICGRLGLKVPDVIQVVRDERLLDWRIARIVQLSTVLIVSDVVAEVIRGLGLTGVTLNEVETV